MTSSEEAPFLKAQNQEIFLCDYKLVLQYLIYLQNMQMNSQPFIPNTLNFQRKLCEREISLKLNPVM